MAVAYSSEPVVGKSAAVQVADIVAEPVVIEVDMPVVASVEQEPELEADNLVALAADMAAACSFEPVAGKSVPVPFADPVVEMLVADTSAELLVADLLEQAVVPSS